MLSLIKTSCWVLVIFLTIVTLNCHSASAEPAKKTCRELLIDQALLPITISNLAQMVWSGMRGGWYSSPLGLRAEGNRVFGSPYGGKVARIIHEHREKYGTEYVMDDQWLAEHQATGTAHENTVTLPSSFMTRPSLGTLLHENVHIQTIRERNLSRLIRIKSADHRLRWALEAIAHDDFGVDEVEAGIVTVNLEKASLTQEDLVEAQAYAYIQDRLIRQFLAAMPSFTFQKTKYIGTEQEVLLVEMREWPVDRDKMREWPEHIKALPRASFQIPLPENWPTKWEEQFQLIRQILQGRLDQLEALKAGQLGDYTKMADSFPGLFSAYP